MVGPAVKLAVAAIMAAAQTGPSGLDRAAPRIIPAALATLPPYGRVQAGLEPAREPPEGSGVEFTRYVAPPQLHNGFLPGGLIAWTGVLFGSLLLLEKRRLAALAVAGGGVVVGVALMLTGVI
jgi:hypothetical protein